MLKPSTSSSLVASFLSSWRYIFIWPNHYYLSYLTQSLSFIASARNNNRCSSSFFSFFLTILYQGGHGSDYWEIYFTPKSFGEMKIRPQNFWDIKVWQQNFWEVHKIIERWNYGNKIANGISKFSTSEEAGNTRLR